MRTTIDKAGRVVIPAALRERLGEITAGKSAPKLKRMAKMISSKYGL